MLLILQLSQSMSQNLIGVKGIEPFPLEPEPALTSVLTLSTTVTSSTLINPHMDGDYYP